MQNSTVNSSFPWVNANFASNTSNSSKAQWQDYQNLAADLLFKNNQNIYPSTISQLAAHTNYLEKMSNLAAATNSTGTNDMQSSSSSNQANQSQLPDLNDLNGLNEKCPHYDDRNKFSCEICIQQYSLNLNSKGKGTELIF